MQLVRSHVVGSLLRPPELLEARQAAMRGELPAVALKRIEDRAVDEAIALQERAGIGLITDGEQRRYVFTDSLGGSVSGITLLDIGDTTEGIWHGSDADVARAVQPQALPVITARLVRSRSLAAEEFTYARARATRPLKVTLPSPACCLIYWSERHSRAAYCSAREALEDVAAILRDEVRELLALGCEHVQFDAPELTMLIDPHSAPVYESAGFTRESFRETIVELLQSAAAEPGVTYSVHLCRGNNQGMWHSAGGYEAIVQQVFPALKAFRYLLLEYDDERSGSFAALADVPDDKCVVLGLVSTKRAALEPRDLLARRIDEAARHFPRAQLALSTQCGFASSLFGNPVSPQAQEAKLQLVATVAAETWG